MGIVNAVPGRLGMSMADAMCAEIKNGNGQCGADIESDHGQRGAEIESARCPRSAGIKNENDQHGTEIERRKASAIPISRMRMVKKAGD